MSTTSQQKLRDAKESIEAFLASSSPDDSQRQFHRALADLRSARQLIERETIQQFDGQPDAAARKAELRAYWKREDTFALSDPVLRFLRFARNGDQHGGADGGYLQVHSFEEYTGIRMFSVPPGAEVVSGSPGLPGGAAIYNRGTPDERAEPLPISQSQWRYKTQIVGDVSAHCGEPTPDTSPEGVLKLTWVYYRDLWYAAREQPPREMWHEPGDPDTF